MSLWKLSRSKMWLMILLIAGLLLMSAPASAQVSYSIQIREWSPVLKEWEVLRGRPVFFIIDGVIMPSTWETMDGYVGVEVGRRARSDWTAYVGPYRWQYYYHTENSDPPNVPPKLGGFEFPTRITRATVSITEL